MVSLMRRTNLPTGGAVYFNDAIIGRDNEDTEPLEPMVGMEENFRVLHTVLPVSLLIVFTIITSIVITVLLFLYEHFRHCESFVIMLFIHAAYWCISWMLHNHLMWKHKMLRINGYLEFYKHIDRHAKAQFYIVSLWNAILLVVSALYHYAFKEMEQRCLNASTDPLSPNTVAYCLLIVESIIVCIVLLAYIGRVRSFNRMRPPPDVHSEDWMMSFMRDSFSSGDVGYRTANEHIHDLLEKQADLIRHLQEHNAMLNHKIIQLRTRAHVEPECT